MEDQTDFDLNRAIRHWRGQLGQSPAYRAENLEELEAHLRDSVSGLMGKGLTEEEVFLVATRRIGASGALEPEFAKINDPGAGAGRRWWGPFGQVPIPRRILGLMAAAATVLLATVLFAYLPLVGRVGNLTASGAGLELGEWQVTVVACLTAVMLSAILALCSLGVRFASSLTILSGLALCGVTGTVGALYSLRSQTGILNQYGHGVAYGEWWASVIPWTFALGLVGLCAGSSLVYWVVDHARRRAGIPLAR
ncbi:MAG: hypothetical protein FJ387_29985 [Verrucomicrobia bacterium]|nr:hypothetical protein [Verrucomicrobiota bacterium]